MIQARGQGGERQVEKHDVVLVTGNGGILDYHASLVLSPHAQLGRPCQTNFAKPLPEPDEDSSPFFEGGMEGRLILMQCTECGAIAPPARQHCDNCLSEEFEWVEASGKGTVRTFGMMHQSYHPGWADGLAVQRDHRRARRRPADAYQHRRHSQMTKFASGCPLLSSRERHEDVALPKFRPA